MLILKDGTKFDGVSIGSKGTKTGHVILYTGVVGYQEVITDPANAGKIIVMTYPLIGNYGINRKFDESKKAWCAGMIIKQESKIYSNFQAEESFNKFLAEKNVICLSEVDTRTLAVKIRDAGEQIGTISSKHIEKAESLLPSSMLAEISVREPVNMVKSGGKKVAVIDLGMSNSFLKQLQQLKCDVWSFPFNTDAPEILKIKPDRVIISNGPEEDPGLDIVLDTVKKILGRVSVLGISTGHLVIAKALGAKIKKMKIGHRGVNYPVMSLDSFKGEITVQNHGLVVDEGSLDKSIKVVERNLNDKTVEKMYSEKYKFVSLQYYPASPGFDEPHPELVDFIHGGKIHAKA